MFWPFSKKSKEEVELANQLRQLTTIKVTLRGGVSIDPSEVYRQQVELKMLRTQKE